MLDRYRDLMPKSEHRKLMLSLAGIHYNKPIEEVKINVVPRKSYTKATKSPATVVAETSTEVPAEVMSDGTEGNPQEVVKPENLIDVPKPSFSDFPVSQKNASKAILNTIAKRSKAGKGWKCPATYSPSNPWWHNVILYLVESGQIVEKESGIYWIA